MRLPATLERGGEGGKERCMSVRPLAFEVKQVILLLFLGPPAFIPTPVLFLDARRPAEASTGSRHDDVEDHLEGAERVHRLLQLSQD